MGSLSTTLETLLRWMIVLGRSLLAISVVRKLKHENVLNGELLMSALTSYVEKLLRGRGRTVDGQIVDHIFYFLFKNVLNYFDEKLRDNVDQKSQICLCHQQSS